MRDIHEIQTQTRAALTELLDAAGLPPFGLVAVGCSSSEISGARLGTDSSPEVGRAVFETVHALLTERGLFLAAQCCEHLNRALVTERAAVLRYGFEVVNAVPRPKAGGSFATAAYAGLDDPVLVEAVRADAGIDIGGTLIGMHLKAVAVPVKLTQTHIGAAHVTAAWTRPKFVGGARAEYDEKLL